MTDAQIITIAAAFLAAVIAVLFNNSRIGDLRTDVNTRMTDMNTRMTDMNTRINDVRDSINKHIDDKYALLDSKLDHIIEMLASHHERIARIENK